MFLFFVILTCCLPFVERAMITAASVLQQQLHAAGSQERPDIAAWLNHDLALLGGTTNIPGVLCRSVTTPTATKRLTC